MRKTFIDAGVLIIAARGVKAASTSALAILGDCNRAFASSPFVQLEVLPKAVFHAQSDETDFYENFFDSVIHWANDLELLLRSAQELACTYGLAGMDALHVAAALAVGADELITTETVIAQLGG